MPYRPRLLVLESPPVRFRLANLLYLTAVVAIIVAVWTRFVRHNVYDIQFDQRGVTVWFSEEWHEWTGEPYYDYETGELIDPHGTLNGNILLRNAHFGLPWSIVAGLIVAVGAIECASHVLIWRFRSRRGVCPEVPPTDSLD